MNLNLNEQLLRDTKDAHICIFIANLAAWLRTNIDKEKYEQRNIREGQCWSYNSIKDFKNYFDFWSIKNIRTIIKHCEQQGLIIISNFNKHKYDKTSWYTLTDKALQYYPILKEKIHTRASSIPINTDLSETANGKSGNGKPIPENLNSLSSSITTNTTISGSKSKSVELMQDLIAVYRQEFPNNPQPHPRVIATSLHKTLQTLIKGWPGLDPQGKKLEVDAFRRYLSLLRTSAPKFSLGEYTTKDGNKKKNGMETFCRWNTVIKFLEGAYS